MVRRGANGGEEWSMTRNKLEWLAFVVNSKQTGLSFTFLRLVLFSTSIPMTRDLHTD